MGGDRVAPRRHHLVSAQSKALPVPGQTLAAERMQGPALRCWIRRERKPVAIDCKRRGG